MTDDKQYPKPRRFTKKPVTIEAIQYTEAIRDAHLFDGAPLPDGVNIIARTLHPRTRTVYYANAFIETLEGRMYVDIGDWIITGVKGEKYPCKPDIFEATYEDADRASRAQAAPPILSSVRLHNAWANGFRAALAWRQSVDEFWKDNEFGKAPREPENPYKVSVSGVHDLFETKDKDAPDAIRDGNGEVPATVPTSLPEPDFTLDGGTVGCYYESTVRRFLAAQPAEGVPASSLQPSELATHEVATPPTGVPAQGDAEDDEDQRELESIGRAVNRAATDLPLGARLRIDLERDAGSVCWLDRGKGAWRTIEGAGEFFSNQIHAAIDAAMAQGKEGES